MGHKVNPKGFRTGVLFFWDSKWFARGTKYSQDLRVDLTMKKFLEKELKPAGVTKIEIERTMNALTIVVHAAKPGVVIGRQGAGAEEIKKKIRTKFFGSKKITLNLNIMEVEQPGMNASLVVQSVAADIEKRMPFRRVMKQSIERVQKAGAQGVKITVAGRLNGAEIASSETRSWGTIPLHTLRAHIDYSCGTARTMYGAIGVKVWVYRGEVFNQNTNTAGK